MAEKDFDDILISLGTSKWNFFHFICISLTGFMMPSLILSGAFSTPNINHTCKPQISEAITNIDECHYMDSQNETQSCSSWEYESEYFPKSMTQEFDLVCEKAYLRPTFQTCYMIGNFIGAPVNGFLADRFGRRKVIIAGTLVLLTSGMISTFLSAMHLIIIFRFVMGMCHSAARTTGYILGLEICEPKHRTAAGILLSLCWGLGVMWYGILGYLVRDWRWLQRASLIPGILTLFMLKYFSESPRWLIVNGKFEEALKSLKYAAKKNGASLPPEDDIVERMKRIQKSSLSETRNNTELTSKTAVVKYVFNQMAVLFRTPAMRRLILLMYVLYFVASLVYYGLTLNATNFNLDPYMYMLVGGAIELPAYSLIIPIIQKFGRIPPTAISYLASGIVVLVLAFISNDPKWLVITLAMLGRLFISVAFQLIILLASEAYPTEVRMQGIGTSQLVSRIGSIAAPYVTESVAETHMWVPSVIFGVTSLIAGFVSLLVPETLNTHLPETITMLELKYAEKKDKQIRKNLESGSSDNRKCNSTSSENYNVN